MNKLMANVNFDSYVSRMEGVTDKDKLLEFIPKDSKILDYGCGSGVLAKNFSPLFYAGYDIEKSMLRKARSLNPGYYFTHNLREVENIDSVVYSSVLHEVYSYNNNSIEKVVESLREGVGIINDGGSLIIRDGVMGADLHNVDCEIKLVNGEDALKFLEYVKEGPQDFSKLSIRGDVLIGNFDSIVNFLNIYTWGWGSVERERNEKVNFATLREWHEIFEEASLNVLHEEVYKQDSYFEHLSKIIDVETLPQQWNTKVIFKLENKK